MYMVPCDKTTRVPQIESTHAVIDTGSAAGARKSGTAKPQHIYVKLAHRSIYACIFFVFPPIIIPRYKSIYIYRDWHSPGGMNELQNKLRLPQLEYSICLYLS